MKAWISTLWYTLLLAGILFMTFLSNNPQAAGLLGGSIYLLLLAYGLYEVWFKKNREYLAPLTGGLFAYGSLFFYIHPFFPVFTWILIILFVFFVIGLSEELNKREKRLR